jgi:hypothetical protein
MVEGRNKMSKKYRPPNRKVDVFKFISIRGDDDCWLWTGGLVGRDSRPYFSVDGKKLLAYRIVYELWTGKELTPQTLMRHKCDNRVCCNPAHLEEGSHQKNMDDMKERARHGMPHQSVRHIKKLILQKVPYSVIAERYGCSKSLISEIANGRAYTHVDLQDGRFSDPVFSEDELSKGATKND